MEKTLNVLEVPIQVSPSFSTKNSTKNCIILAKIIQLFPLEQRVQLLQSHLTKQPNSRIMTQKQSHAQLESGLNPDRETIEFDKLLIKTAISIKATVIMKVINEIKEPSEEIAVCGESKAEDKDMVSRMRIRRYSTLKEFKHHVEQIL